MAGNEDELPTETHDDGGQHNSEEPPETSCQGGKDTDISDNSGKSGLWSDTL